MYNQTHPRSVYDLFLHKLHGCWSRPFFPHSISFTVFCFVKHQTRSREMGYSIRLQAVDEHFEWNTIFFFPGVYWKKSYSIVFKYHFYECEWGVFLLYKFWCCNFVFFFSFRSFKSPSFVHVISQTTSAQNSINTQDAPHTATQTPKLYTLSVLTSTNNTHTHTLLILLAN